MPGKRGRSAITVPVREPVHGEEQPEDDNQREHRQESQEEEVILSLGPGPPCLVGGAGQT